MPDQASHPALFGYRPCGTWRNSEKDTLDENPILINVSILLIITRYAKLRKRAASVAKLFTTASEVLHASQILRITALPTFPEVSSKICKVVER